MKQPWRETCMCVAKLAWPLLGRSGWKRVARQAESDGGGHMPHDALHGNTGLCCWCSLLLLGSDRRQPGGRQLAVVRAGCCAKSCTKAGFCGIVVARNALRVAALLLQQSRKVEPRHRRRQSAASRADRRRSRAGAAHLAVAAHRGRADGPASNLLRMCCRCCGRCVSCGWSGGCCQRADGAVRVQQRRLSPSSGHTAATALHPGLWGQHVCPCPQVGIHHAHDSNAARACSEAQACILVGKAVSSRALWHRG